MSSRPRRPLYAVAFLLLCLALVVSLAWAVTFGSANLTTGQVYTILLEKAKGTAPASMITDIVWLVRLPRLVLAIAVGSALSLSGCVMQALARNPLADPYILGISSGASLGATLGLLWGWGASPFGLDGAGVCAFLGALLASALVMALAHAGGKPGPVKLLLAGAAVSALFSALSSLLVYLESSAQASQRVMFWTMGSLAGAKWGSNLVLLGLVLLAALFFTWRAPNLDLLALGDETALSLGVNPFLARPCYMIFVALLVGLAVYTSGLVGFVGLVVPHGVRLVAGSAHRRLVPLATVCGGLFLLWADVVSRVALKGTELPIGLITALVGSPWFIILMARTSRKDGAQ